MLKDILSDGIYALFNKVSYFGAKTLAIVLITRELGIESGGVFIFLIGTLEIL
ncbi:O17/O44/O106 family O-antigen flippase, partial [Enterobacter hormaechei subsp. hoffmannii]